MCVQYCTARRPTSSLRGKRSDYINSFKAVALAVRRAFPFVVVQVLLGFTTYITTEITRDRLLEIDY
jgi:hypothetical protein